MNNKKSTKRTLLTSVLSLVLCMAMLIGTTFAWFTDSVTSGVNTIQSGTLEIELQYQKEDGTWANAEGVTLDFKKAAGAPKDEAILWEPGCTYELPAVKVVNKGNLAVKYEIVISGIDGDAKLNEVIDWTYNDTTLESTGTLLKGQESEAITIKGHMQEKAGNDYQGLQINGISIAVYATQLASEYDSFNNTYDTNASFLNVDADGNYLISNADELMYFAKTVNVDNNSYAGKTVKLTSNINLAGKNWMPIGQTGATEFKGVFDGQNYTISNMTVNNTDTSANCASGLFGWIESHGNEGVTVKNVKFDNANVTGHHNVAVVAGYIYGTIEGCEVKNSTIIAVNANDDANGDKVGAIAGYVGDATINNNKVEKCVVKGNRDIGGIAGTVGTGVYSFQNNSVKNTKITYETERTYASAGELVSGRTGFTPDTTNTTSGNEIIKKVVTSAASQDELKAAIASGGEVEVSLTEGTYAMPSVANKDVTISGTKGTVITIDKPNLTGTDVSFEGVTVQGSGVYTGVQHVDTVTYDNVTIQGEMCLYGNEVVFNDCTFELKAEQYIWTYGVANVEFNNCEFNSQGKALLVYGDSPSDLSTTCNVSINDCKFYAGSKVEGKAAIEIDSRFINMVVEINNTTSEGFDNGSISGNSLWNNKKGNAASVTVDGVAQTLKEAPMQ